ncbi:hypothetical protein IW262DRAFT_1298887 [Armillaria fumosa]|nr:hypothetical protein IW262DRAFT_1298887 [Armillaria fumosa]
MMKVDSPKDAIKKQKEESMKHNSRSKCGKKNDGDWDVVSLRAGPELPVLMYWQLSRRPWFGKLKSRDISNIELGNYGTGLALLHRGSDVPTGYPSMQDSSASSDSREPATAFLENGVVDRMSPSPPDSDRNLPAESQDTTYVYLRESTQVHSGRHQRQTGQRYESSGSESGPAMNHGSHEPCSDTVGQQNNPDPQPQHEESPSGQRGT